MPPRPRVGKRRGQGQGDVAWSAGATAVLASPMICAEPPSKSSSTVPVCSRYEAQRGCARTAWTRGACSSVRLLPTLLQTLSTWRVSRMGLSMAFALRRRLKLGLFRERDAWAAGHACTLGGIVSLLTGRGSPGDSSLTLMWPCS